MRPETLRLLGRPVPDEALGPSGPRLQPRAKLDLQTEREILLQLKVDVAALQATLRFERQLRDFKAGFDPNQPRDDHGRWTDDGQSSSEAGSEDEQPVRLAGEIPTNEPSEVPKERPPSERERNRVARDVSRNPRLRGVLGLLLSGAEHWLREKFPEIVADQDPPKSLEELHEAVSTPTKGYDIHHIVEQGSARQDGFPEDMINAPDNLVQILRFQHWRINSWYETPNKDYSGLRPREYLRGKSWEERRRVGLDTLVVHGVLKP